MAIAYLLLNTVQFLFLLTWTAFWISAATVMTLLTFSKDIALKMARLFWGPGLIWGSGGKLQVEPLPDIDWSQPHIFAMNHESSIDIPIAFTVIPVNIRFIAKHVLKYVPFLGWYMWMTGMIFVNRSNRAEAMKSMAMAGERIRAGANILAYPEGTRSRSGKILSFKKGAFMVALEAGVPIVPVAICGSAKVVPATGFALRPGIIRMKLGMPIPTKGLKHDDRERLMAGVRDAIIRLHQEIGGDGGEPIQEHHHAHQA